MQKPRFAGGCVAAALATLLACSSASPPAPELGSGSKADGGATTDAGGGDIPSERIEAVPARDCPPAFDGPGKAPVAGDNTGFEVAGQSRRFQLLLPPTSFSGPRPILFAFHGTTESGPKFIARAKLTDFAARGFVVIAPDAVGNGSIWPVWDAMRAPGKESLPNADVELFDRLLSCTAAHFEVDKKRVFATGHSAGGIFTNRLLRTRSNVLAGGIVASGVFDLTGGAKGPLESMLAVVTWGGDNDTYRGTTPSGVHVPSFSFVEQASLASKFYEAEPAVEQVHCRGDDLGHAWLPLNDWFASLLLSHPKGTPASPSFVPPGLPAGAKATCSGTAFELPPLPEMTCPKTARAGCTEACQLFADCAVENRTVGPSLAAELSKLGFTSSSCSGCVQGCQAGATTVADAEALACFRTKQATATCGPGIEGASPLFQIVNECCAGKSGSTLCVELCEAIVANDAAKTFFPTCQQLVK